MMMMVLMMMKKSPLLVLRSFLLFCYHQNLSGKKLSFFEKKKFITPHRGRNSSARGKRWTDLTLNETRRGLRYRISTQLIVRMEYNFCFHEYKVCFAYEFEMFCPQTGVYY